MAEQHLSRRLGRDDWTTAALAALAEGGVAAVAIEPLAKRLGATKGSAYWHFANREALLTAALERWERDQTETVIERIDTRPDPKRRLQALFAMAMGPESDLRIELALRAAVDVPVVADVVHRVIERRITYLTALFVEAGFGRKAARRRALLAYSVYLGQAQLRRSSPESLPSSGKEHKALLDDALRGVFVR